MCEWVDVVEDGIHAGPIAFLRRGISFRSMSQWTCRAAWDALGLHVRKNLMLGLLQKI